MSNSELMAKYLVPGCHAHLIGIGGVSMRPLGLTLKGRGLVITGSDMNSSVSTDDLKAQGIPIAIGHRAENIEGADCVIRTAAVHNDNPEIAAARAAGIPVFERAQAWGAIMKEFQNAICISGTHGKTTTTSMMTHVLMEADLDPTVMIGGNLPLLGAGHRVGKGDTIVLESCEYCDSFLNFFPSIAVILNIEADHLDYFKDLKAIQKSFRKFAELSRDVILANGDDAPTVEALNGLDYITFGFGEKNRVHPDNISSDYRHFDVMIDDRLFTHIDLGVIGRHNLLNALSVVAVAWYMGITPDAVSRGIASFHGAERRMQKKGEYNGAEVFDDYAHHPGELAATIEAISTIPHNRLIVAFQPHTYTRTHALFDEFVEQLKRPDITILAEIYAARERNTIGISSNDLVQMIPGSIYCETLPEVTECLKRIIEPGDIVMTIGAGDIYRAGESLLKTEK